MGKAQTNTMAARLFLGMIGVMLVLVGGIFEWLMIRSFMQAKASRAWPQVQATVLQAEMDRRQVMGSPSEYRFNLLFGYTYEGQALTSNTLSPRGSKWSRDESSVTRLATAYQVGSMHVAWVNPDQPGQAILRHDTKAAGYTLWFPGLIIVGGCGMIWGAWRWTAKPHAGQE